MITSVHIIKCYGINAKKLWSGKYIYAIWVSNGTLRLKLTESGCVHIITHSQDLDELFPENELLKDQQ